MKDLDINSKTSDALISAMHDTIKELILLYGVKYDDVDENYVIAEIPFDEPIETCDGATLYHIGLTRKDELVFGWDEANAIVCEIEDFPLFVAIDIFSQVCLRYCEC